ncbi:SAM-dependent methyltransferase [Domibacillus antri]|uniref:SAM-dependent methyltransferase n=1 Tax=Domibacillus antri TaxID=1714264 RepID=A0A1Q8Q4F5_9BACI|nr:class I SAM-dependent methyltransferase [Domibacillus antri]OLN22236.1 SAM-dependent methyltransferase [Domibacillus antri]
MNNTYLDLLAYFGIGGAHPGGFPFTQRIFQDERISPADSVLEIGCGTGQTAAFIAQKYSCRVTAVDHHPIMIEKAKERFKDSALRVHVIEGDAQNLPFQDHSFDFILAESVISFMDISRTLQELFRLVKRDGRLVMIEMTAEEPLTQNVQRKVGSLYGIHEVLSEQEWKMKLQETGFTKIDMLPAPSERIETAIADMNPSENISDELYDRWDEHNAFLSQTDVPLGFRAFRCGFHTQK